MTLPPPITSRSNVRVKALRTAFSGASRSPGEVIGIEGDHLLNEALRSGTRFDCVFLVEGKVALLGHPALAAVDPKNIVVLSRDAFASVVDTDTPQGIAATFRIPPVKPRNLQTEPGLYLVVEGLQDPGNLGTLLRTAEAFGVCQVFATPETCSQWNPKAMRASAGSAFRIPVVRTSISEAKRGLREAGIRLIAAVAQADGATPAMSADLLLPCALMIGNEGAGLSAGALMHADERVHIPCRVESLNAAVAGSALMYEAMRQNLNGKAEGPA